MQSAYRSEKAYRISGQIWSQTLGLQTIWRLYMTVCVAAMCEQHQIIGASDRMLTAGDIQFEPQQQKIIPVTNSIVLMIAGDSALQSEIIQRVQSDIRVSLTEHPDDWLNVRNVADIY